MGRRLGLGLTGMVAAVACVVPASAGAVALHGLTPMGCISDVDAAETCGGLNGGPNEAQGLTDANGVAVSPDGTSVYVASTAEDAIARFIRGPAGTLTPAGCLDDVAGPNPCGPGNEVEGLDGARSVAVSPDGESVYVVSGIFDQAIVHFNRAPDGSLTAAGCINDVLLAANCGPGNQTAALNGATGLAVSPNGGSVYVGSEDSNAIVRFNRGTNGDLTPAGCFDDAAGLNPCGPGNEFEGLFAARGLAISPDGNSVYVTAAGDQAITRFNRTADGTLTYGGCIDIQGGVAGCGSEALGLAEPTEVAISPESTSIYVTSRGFTTSAIAHFNFDGVGAGLTAVGCISDVDENEQCGGSDDGPQEAQGLDGAWGVVVSPDGATVHVASYDDGAIVSFPRAGDGSLNGDTAACFVTVGGGANCGLGNEVQGLTAVRGIAVSPGGESVYGTSFGSNAITRFNRELTPVCSETAASGAPEQPLTVQLNCSDPNLDPLVIAPLSAPANGTLEPVDQGTGTVVYTPNPGFFGTDSFTYAATADAKQSNVVTAQINLSPTDPPPPELGKTVNLRPVSGTILVDIPRDGQGFIPIEFAVQVPVRTKVDAREGRVEITTATKKGGTQTAEFYDGRFQIRQGKRSDLATMRLLERPKCAGAAGGRDALASRKRRPGLWGNGSGNFATQGNHGSASVRGTKWLVFEACGGITGTTVRRGRVLFRNFYTGRRTIVRAGETAIARPLARP